MFPENFYCYEIASFDNELADFVYFELNARLVNPEKEGAD